MDVDSHLHTVVGQARATRLLTAALASGKLHHGLLFEGPEGVGKATTALALAKALNCEGDTALPCASCAKVDAGQHPDVIHVDMTQKGLTERVRDLISALGFAPHEGRARLVLFDPADALANQRAEAANALLKTLEEPPARTHFVLITAEPRRLPPTVRSRLERVRFDPLADEVVERLLIERHGAAPELARLATVEALGSLGRAVAAIGASEELQRREQRMDALLGAAAQAHRDPRPVFEAAVEMGYDRDEAERVLTLLYTTVHHALVVALARDRLPTARADKARSRMGDRTPAELWNAAAGIQEAIECLRGFVSPPLVLEHLLFQLGAPAAHRRQPRPVEAV